MMQTDVKSTALAASGEVVAGPGRVKSIVVAYASGGTVIIKDGGSGGTTVFSFSAPAAAGAINILLPGEGIKCNTTIYASLTSATATVVYG